MSAHPSGSGVAARLAPAQPKIRGFLHIDRHGGGPQAIYVLTYHRVNENHVRPKPILAEGAQELIELLERIGVDFHLREVRGALEDILRLGSANIPGLWLTDEEMVEKGLVES
jgi:predicted ThiF/HesA family dinucleotide-utilizing enzyme